MGPSNSCRECGFVNPWAWRTCAKCGSSLSSDVTTITGATVIASSPLDPANVDNLDQTQEVTEGYPDGLVEEDVELENEPEASPKDAGQGGPLIGQQEAAEAIRTAIEKAFSTKEPTLVALHGPRGSGKSRLLTYASEIAAGTDETVHVAYATCREGGDGSYAPFGRMLLERFGVTPASSPSAVRGQMSTLVGAALDAGDPVLVGETTHLLGHMAGVPFPDSPFLTPLQKNPADLHRRTADALRRLYEGDAKQRPAVVLLDNMHLAESEAWDVLEALCRAAGPIAIVVAGDDLTDRIDALEPAGGTAIGPVPPLREEDVATMLHVLLPDLKKAPEPLVAAVTHRTEGLPSAVRELVFALWEAGLFVRKDDGIEVDLERLEAGDLPVTMKDAITARLRRLDALEHATVERAAVIGEVFWDAALLGQMRSERPAPGEFDNPLSIWPDDEDAEALEGALSRLIEKGFLEQHERSDMPGSREFVFAHSGTRNHLYENMDPSLRPRRHAAVARWLTLVSEVRREGVAAMIAPHLEKAGLNVRAGRAYLEAAHYERNAMRTERGLRYVEKALAHVPDEDTLRRIECLHLHGSLLSTNGRFDEAILSFTEMLSLAWSIGARGKGGAALNRIARVHRARGELKQARQLLDRALHLFRVGGDVRGVAATLDDLAQVGLLAGETDAAIAWASEALEIRRAHADPRGEAVSLTTLGTLQLNRGALDEGSQLFERALELRRHVGDVSGIVTSLNALGVVAFERGNREDAIAKWHEALGQARDMADRHSECFLLNNVGEAHLGERDFDQAEAALGDAQRLAEDLGDRRALADVLRNLGVLARLRGDDDARDRLEEALAGARDYGGPEAIALAHQALGQQRAATLFDESGEPDTSAEEHFLASIDLFRQTSNERGAARSLVELARFHVERGDVELAKERFREARSIFRRMGLPDADSVEQTLKELGDD